MSIDGVWDANQSCNILGAYDHVPGDVVKSSRLDWQDSIRNLRCTDFPDWEQKFRQSQLSMGTEF
jgi:hypothetical protein